MSEAIKVCVSLACDACGNTLDPEKDKDQMLCSNCRHKRQKNVRGGSTMSYKSAAIIRKLISRIKTSEGYNNGVTLTLREMDAIIWSEQFLPKEFRVGEACGPYGARLFIRSDVSLSPEIEQALNNLSCWGGNTANSDQYRMWEFPLRDTEERKSQAMLLLMNAGWIHNPTMEF